MNTSLFLPKEIKVGYQERKGTYTGKLAYIIYIDEKGVVRKEKSFDGWRNKDLGADQYANEPMSGFVLNKKAGGYDTGWNHRQTYVRIYDPRGFEFEVSVENLLYILDNTSSIIGKGLEGEFVYAWSGTELVLLPVNAPEYESLKELNDLRHKKDYIKAKDLKVGNTYLTKDNRQLVYLGKFDEYSHSRKTLIPEKSTRKKFWFSSLTKSGYDKDYRIETFSAVSQRLIDVVEDFPNLNLDGMLEKLENMSDYSPVDHSKTEVEPHTLEGFLEKVKKQTRSNGFMSPFRVIAQNKSEYYIEYRDKTPRFSSESYSYWSRNNKNVYEGEKYDIKSFEDIFNVLKPEKHYYFKENGRLHTTEGDM